MKKIQIKKTALSKSTVIDWYKANTGVFPGKLELKKLPMGIMVYLDGTSVGVLGTDVNGTFAAYADTDLIFDDKGTCMTEYTLTVNGVTPNLLLDGELDVRVVENKEIQTSADVNSFSKEIEEVVNAGCISRENAERNIRAMLMNRVSEAVIRGVLATYKPQCRPVACPGTFYVPVDENDRYLEEVLVQYLIHGHCVLEGGQSVGKNTLAETAAMVLNRPSSRLSCKADMTSDDWFGGKSTDNSASLELTPELAKKAFEGDKDAAARYDVLKAQAASVKIVNEESAYLRAIQGGEVMVLDEWNMCDPNLASAMVNPVTDKAGRMFVPGRGYVDISDDCFIIATQNPRFAGTQEQNQATTSRFGIIELGYPKSICAPLNEALKNEEVPKLIINTVNKLYMELVKAYKDGEITDASLNIRGFIRAIQASVRFGANLRKQIVMQVVNNCPVEERGVIGGKVNLLFE